MMLGGMLWVLTYMVEIVIGVTLGEAAYNRAEPSTSALVWLWPAFFMGALFFLGIGLLGVSARLEGRSRKLRILGALLASTAIIAAFVNLVLLTGIFGKVMALDGVGFLGVIGVVFGSILLGIATLRAKVLPRWASVVLTLAAFLFIPAIIVTIPLESVAPEYVIADLPFPVVGIALATVGYAMLANRTSEAGQPARTPA
ncbi:MAG: hypothetical protein AVDCRST_MAG14-1357 [uncultured Rubrobacteraceae bacterium]|uniref:Uncharacterized protein n=1 Tax=uncultured Rubrobacteraceae bacterium TaxID=349277 RepID=A0A6J4QT88_9ACTN|nr:MAG: hypothetical protein AVDCRST_MAG14-1357 [uncultured Rubrobacteraceae bacterium]